MISFITNKRPPELLAVERSFPELPAEMLGIIFRKLKRIHYASQVCRHWYFAAVCAARDVCSQKITHFVHSSLSKLHPDDQKELLKALQEFPKTSTLSETYDIYHRKNTRINESLILMGHNPLAIPYFSLNFLPFITEMQNSINGVKGIESAEIKSNVIKRYYKFLLTHGHHTKAIELAASTLLEARKFYYICDIIDHLNEHGHYESALEAAKQLPEKCDNYSLTRVNRVDKILYHLAMNLEKTHESIRMILQAVEEFPVNHGFFSGLAVDLINADLKKKLVVFLTMASWDKFNRYSLRESAGYLEEKGEKDLPAKLRSYLHNL